MRRILIEDKEIDPKGCSYGFPWKHDSICFNFRMPEELVLATDIDKIPDMSDIEVVVIGCDLDDYSFLGRMENLEILYIYSGENIKELSFLQGLTNLRQLNIVKSHVENLDALVRLMKEQKKIWDTKDIGERVVFGLDAINIESDKPLDGEVLKTPNLYVKEMRLGKKRIR